MKTEKQDVSPFAALSFSQQQDKWREWRSRQLEYKKAAEDNPLPMEETDALQENHMPPAPAAPTRHRELDKVLARHKTALRRTGQFMTTQGNNPPGK